MGPADGGLARAEEEAMLQTVQRAYACPCAVWTMQPPGTEATRQTVYA